MRNPFDNIYRFVPAKLQPRYGDNPANAPVKLLLRRGLQDPLGGLRSLNGTPSKGNIWDIETGRQIVSRFDPENSVVAVVVKHRMPTAIAVGPDTPETILQIYRTNKEFLEQGVLVTNGHLDQVTAELLRYEIMGFNFDHIAARQIDSGAEDDLVDHHPKLGIHLIDSFQVKSGQKQVEYLGEDYRFEQKPLDIDAILATKRTLIPPRIPVDSSVLDFGLKTVLFMHTNAAVVIARYSLATLAMASENGSRSEANRKALQRAAGEGGVLVNDGTLPYQLLQQAKLEGINQIILPGSEKDSADLITEADKLKIGLTLVNSRLFSY